MVRLVRVRINDVLLSLNNISQKHSACINILMIIIHFVAAKDYSNGTHCVLYMEFNSVDMI